MSRARPSSGGPRKGFPLADKVRLALDVGQTSTKWRMSAATGGAGVRAEGRAAGVNTAQPLPQQWRAIVDSVVAQQPGMSVDSVAIGSSGLGRETAHDLMCLVADDGVHHIIVAHDSITSYLGALGDQHGCVIAAGTGSICLAVGPDHWARVDGWGHLLGDAGSAYWIGRTGMEAALRGHDGRRQMTALTGALTDLYPDLELAYLDLQSAPDRVARIAAFAETVAAMAEFDRVAGNILDKAAAHLSEAVQAGIRRAHLHGPAAPKVAALGGVFASDRVLRRFTEYLTLHWPEFALTEPIGTGIDGADALFDLPPGHPLFPQLSIAER
ncbi:MAG: BadF/BadG/BcrA/BcrD ATPase family protein [Propioniciclava sp.]|uniref:N-acetylglucosamine kinase n=1 Tax=Propioniciclava sp. TaxID=2038686 RepID=UPI0039E62A5E